MIVDTGSANLGLVDVCRGAGRSDLNLDVAIAGSQTQGGVRISTFFNPLLSFTSLASSLPTFNVSYMDGSSILCQRFTDRVMMSDDASGTSGSNCRYLCELGTLL